MANCDVIAERYALRRYELDVSAYPTVLTTRMEPTYLRHCLSTSGPLAGLRDGPVE